jgi:hypothetical protein
MTWMLLAVLAIVIAVPLAVRARRGGKKKEADPHNIYPVW